jgi:hypothetical protein
MKRSAITQCKISLQHHLYQVLYRLDMGKLCFMSWLFTYQEMVTTHSSGQGTAIDVCEGGVMMDQGGE